MSNITINGVHPKFITFSDGCENVDVSECLSTLDDYVIQVNWVDCTRDLIRVCLVADALRRAHKHSCDISAYLGYIPNARADRVFQHGNALPIKVFADIINSCNFTDVFVEDPHSDVSTALINNTRLKPQWGLHRDKVNDKVGLGWVLCSPDTGASKKIGEFGFPYIQADKTRDLNTGKISFAGVKESVKADKVLIVDDICDGGGTFIGLAQHLKEIHKVKKVGLLVTHGIFSKGLNVLKPHIDLIICTNIIGQFITKQDINKFNEGNIS